MPFAKGGRRSNSGDSSRGGQSQRARRKGAQKGKWYRNREETEHAKPRKRGWLSGWTRESEPSLKNRKGRWQSRGVETGHLDWARTAVVRASGGPNVSPLIRIRTKVPWRPSSGKSHILHPLGHDDFWTKYFGKQAFVLRRGSHHPVILTAHESAGLLRGATLAENADIMGAHIWNRGGQRPMYSPEHGLPAVAALARGKPVRLQYIERRAKRLYRRDPLVKAMARLAPGRGMAASLHWTPPGARALWEHEDQYEQIIVQVYGVRKWTVCSRGLLPPTAPGAPNKAPPRHPRRHLHEKPGNAEQTKREGKCVAATLRRGDVLYLPSHTWHWTGPGIKASSHLELGVMPLRGSDLVMALGAKNRLLEMGHPIMAMPLPFWRHGKPENAARSVLPICLDLPWAEGPQDIPVICTEPTMRRALQRLSGSSGHPAPWSAPQWTSGGGIPSGDKANWAPRSRHTGIFSPVMEVLQPFAQVVGLLGIVLLLMCLCAQAQPDEKRRGKSAMQIRQERAMLRNNRKAVFEKTSKLKKMN